MLHCVAVLILVGFPCTQAKGPPDYNHSRDNKSFDKDTSCYWNCIVISSGFPVQRKTDFVTNRLVTLVVKYETNVDEKCVNQASRISSKNATEHFKVRLPANNTHSTLTLAVQRALDWVFGVRWAEEYEEVKAVCSLCPLRSDTTTATIPVRDSGFLPQFVRGYLANQGVQFGSRIDCNTEMDNLQPCIIGQSAESNFTVENGRSNAALMLFKNVFLYAIFFYSPAFLCLFSPTEVTENGVRLIILEGASPVSFRSLVGNYFFSDLDTFWHKARMLVLRLVLFPLPFLAPLIILDYILRQRERVSLADVVPLYCQPFTIFPLACYVIQAFYDVTFSDVTYKRNTCLTCDIVESDLMCDGIPLPLEILNHLRIQPLILVKSWRWCIRSLVSYFKLCTGILPREASVACIFRILIFIILFLSGIPVFVVLLLVAVYFGILGTCPLDILIGRSVKPNINSCLNLLWRFLVSFLSFGTFDALLSASYFVMTAIAIAFMLLLHEQGLPFVAFVILVCYYFWTSYSSFTNKYHHFSLTLFECYKKSQQDQISDEAPIIDPVQEATPSTKNKSNVVSIPKRLFDMACEEHMPIREGVCLLLLKVAVIVSFVFLVFLFIMQLNVGSSSLMKALVTFCTGLIPKIVQIFYDGGIQERLETLVNEEKALKIVQDYTNGKISPKASQGQNDYGANTVEVIVRENKENIQMVTSV